MESKPRVRVPKTASAGEVITIKTLINHVMESGQRKGKDGKVIPQHIIDRFEVEFNGQPVISADLHGAVSSNPYFEFTAKVSESGTFKFTWHDDKGPVYTTESKIKVG